MLILDKHGAQWAQASRRLARQLGIQLRWLPKACPELNVVDQLWRRVTDDVLANEPTPTAPAQISQPMFFRAPAEYNWVNMPKSPERALTVEEIWHT